MGKYTLKEWAEKVCKWMEDQAARDRKEAETTRFLSMKDAYIHDAKNNEVMARHGRDALASMPDPAKGVEMAIEAMRRIVLKDSIGREPSNEDIEFVKQALRACGEEVEGGS